MKTQRRVDAVDTVRRRGGVMRVSTLRSLGHTQHVLAGAVSDGVLFRVARGWVAVPEADPHTVAAARSGVVITCVTLAGRRGLWVLRHDRPHVAAPAHSGHVRMPAKVHWAQPLVPRHPDSLEDSLENALALVADCLPTDAALAIWESAMRQQLVQREALARLALGPAARHLLSISSPFSDSGLESFIPLRLRWMRLPVRAQIWICGHRVDFLIGDRLVLQIDGGTHVGAQREADIAHDAQLMLMGYSVIRVGYAQVVDRWHEVQDQIMRAVAQGLHLSR